MAPLPAKKVPPKKGSPYSPVLLTMPPGRKPKVPETKGAGLEDLETKGAGAKDAESKGAELRMKKNLEKQVFQMFAIFGIFYSKFMKDMLESSVVLFCSNLNL